MSLLKQTTKYIIYLLFIQIFFTLIPRINTYSIDIQSLDKDIVYNEEAVLTKYANDGPIDEEKWDVVDEEGSIDDFGETLEFDLGSPDENKLEKRASIKSSEYFRSQLTSFEKKIYDIINTMSSKTTLTALSASIKNLKAYKIKKSYILKYTSRGVGAAIRDHPEFWWLKKYTISYSISSSYVNDLKIKFSTSYSLSNINKMKAKVTSRAKGIAAAAKKKSSTYERLKYIHNYLIKYIKYDDNDDKTTYNIYGALIQNKCSCEGYAESFAYIARLIGVGTISVSSTTHKWNYVYISKKWYVVDVTFDDPIVSGVVANVGSTKNLSYRFFLIGSKTKISGSKTYTTYSNRKLVNFIEFSDATGFKYPTLSTTAYK